MRIKIENELNNIRNKLLDSILFVAIIFIIPASVSSILRVFYTGWLWVYSFHIIESILIIIFFVFRKRFSPLLKTGFIVLFFISTALFGLITFSLNGGLYFFIIAIFIVTLIYGRKYSIFLSGLVILSLLTVSILYINEILKSSINFNEYYKNSFVWVNLLINITFVITSIVYSFGLFYNYFNNLIKTLYVKTEELETEITEHKKAEEALKESEEKLKESNAAKDKFFSIIAHDLRSPFHGFLGLSDVLAKNSDNMTVNEMKNLSLSINESALNIYHFLNELLMWSRTQIGSIPFEPAEHDFYEIVYSSFLILNKTAANKNIELKTNIKENTLVKCDRNMTMTVIRNLIDNAIKFSNPDAEINIIGEIKKKKSPDTLSGDINYLQISVIDTGKGMSKETTDGLYKIDRHISSVGTMGEKGTGLGLILCKEFIEKHGGKIWVESEIDKGSTFYFTLPV